MVERALARPRALGLVTYLDLSHRLDSSYFFHRYEPSEHLNERGRDAATLLATAIQARLEDPTPGCLQALLETVLSLPAS